MSSVWFLHNLESLEIDRKFVAKVEVPMKGSRYFLLILSFIFLAAFFVLASVLNTKAIESFDLSILQAVQEIRHPYITPVIKFFTFIGNTQIVIILSVILMFILYRFFKHRKELFLFSVVLIGTGILNSLLKAFFERERPTLDAMITESGFSFPSGHSMSALSLYGILTFLLWKHIPKTKNRVILLCVAATFILVIGFSRIYLGVHFPSDVIGAYLFSCFWLFFNIWFFKNHLWNRKGSGN